MRIKLYSTCSVPTYLLGGWQCLEVQCLDVTSRTEEAKSSVFAVKLVSHVERNLCALILIYYPSSSINDDDRHPTRGYKQVERTSLPRQPSVSEDYNTV